MPGAPRAHDGTHFAIGAGLSSTPSDGSEEWQRVPAKLDEIDEMARVGG